jgi:hypothetical protein
MRVPSSEVLVAAVVGIGGSMATIRAGSNGTTEGAVAFGLGTLVACALVLLIGSWARRTPNPLLIEIGAPVTRPNYDGRAADVRRILLTNPPGGTTVKGVKVKVWCKQQPTHRILLQHDEMTEQPFDIDPGDDAHVRVISNVENVPEFVFCYDQTVKDPRWIAKGRRLDLKIHVTATDRHPKVFECSALEDAQGYLQLHSG